MDEIEPKFGEWLRGIYASESNPRRDGMYVRTIHRKGRMNPGKFYELTDGNGAFWMYPAQSVERGHADTNGIAIEKKARELLENFAITFHDEDGSEVVYEKGAISAIAAALRSAQEADRG